ncbi:uncharacterized protein [Prorops nasuta]|uniref:uncharacterized protein n=1 Tax=Prorops nasuta TaxID=863751 RepID=UPI0034CFA60D
MALYVKSKGFKVVPWFSTSEWYNVYKLVYSNNVSDQAEAYKMLLVWKARVPKLPVGIDCSLALMQICLRDREWTPKINKGELPIHYEDDLRLMYSTTIMRTLNSISHVGLTKQTSLFQIARQLRIPEWIVNLRHDAAHGHELPSIGIMRTAVNILLTWLHEEYWCVEAKTMEECYLNRLEALEAEEYEETQGFSDLIEIWTSVSLYALANYSLVKKIPDARLRETLEDLRNYSFGRSSSNKECDNVDTQVPLQIDGQYKLFTAKAILLKELSLYITKSNLTSLKKDVIVRVLVNCEAFLPSKEFLNLFMKNEETSELNELPLSILQFWQDIIVLLHENKILDHLFFKLYDLLNNELEESNKRLLASLWLKYVIQAFIKLTTSQQVLCSLQCQVGNKVGKNQSKSLISKVKEKVNKNYPKLKQILWLNLSSNVPDSIKNENFINKCMLEVNEYSARFTESLLELLPTIKKETKASLLELIKIYTNKHCANHDITEKIFTINEILKENPNVNICLQNMQDNFDKAEDLVYLADQTIRNRNLMLAHADHKWSECPIGILPWQIGLIETLEPFQIPPEHYNVFTSDSEVIPGLIDSANLTMQSRVNWNRVLKKKKRAKKRERRDADNIIDTAMKIIKKNKLTDLQQEC